MSEYSMPSYFQTMPVIGKEVAHFSEENAAQIQEVEQEIHEIREAALEAGKSTEASRYNDILVRLRKINDAIPDAAMSDKISRLEAVSAKIFLQAEQNPDKLPQMRKFMDYYLPTALKLLETYAELQAQGIEGENITESKHRIESAMDTLVTAFEAQLDKLFQDDALDVSTDIDVMENMLRADGLTGDCPGPRLQL